MSLRSAFKYACGVKALYCLPFWSPSLISHSLFLCHTPITFPLVCTVDTSLQLFSVANIRYELAMIKIAFLKAFFPFIKILGEGSHRSRHSIILFFCAVPFVFLLCHSSWSWITRTGLERQFLHWIVYSEGRKMRQADLESMYSTEIIVWTVKYFPNLRFV